MCIFVTALLYRCGYFFTVHNNVVFTTPVIDALHHHEWGVRVASGLLTGRGPGDVFKPCLYPTLIGGIYHLFGVNITFVQWGQFFLGTMSAVLTAVVAVMLFGKRAGVIAGFISALYAPYLFFEGQLLTPAVSVAVSLVIITMILSPRPHFWIIGLLSGIAAGVRPDVLLPLGFIFLYRLFSELKTGTPSKLLGKAVLFLAGFSLVAVPLSIRHHALTGQFGLFSTNSGINFYTGNGPDADGVSAIPTGLKWEEAISSIPEHLMENPKARSRLWFTRAAVHIAEEPADWVFLLARKSAAFFNGSEFRNNIGFEWFREDVSLLKFPFIQYWLVVSLSLSGFGILLFKTREAVEREYLIILWVAGYAAAGVLFFVTARYRVPAVPFMIILSAYALAWLYEKCRRDVKGAFRAACLMSLVFVFTWPGWFDKSYRRNEVDDINIGNIYRKSGAFPMALRAYERACTFNPASCDAWFLRGTTLLKMKSYDQATDHLEKAYRLFPRGADILLNMGNAHLLNGERDIAESYFQKVVTLDEKINLFHKRESVAMAHLGLWKLARVEGKAGEAARHMSNAWETDENTTAEFHVVNGLDLVRSTGVFRKTAESESWNWYPRANLGIALARLGRFEEAVKALQRASGIPGSPPGVTLQLARALISSENRPEARRVLEELFETTPPGLLRARIKEMLKIL